MVSSFSNHAKEPGIKTLEYILMISSSRPVGIAIPRRTVNPAKKQTFIKSGFYKAI